MKWQPLGAMALCALAVVAPGGDATSVPPVKLPQARIPLREARGYASRVTRSWARYTWLYGDRTRIALSLSPPGRPKK